MDVWSWVGGLDHTLKDEPRLIEQIEALPGWVLDGHHSQVDAVVPEMLADARRLEQPWLEVFVRHWRLQSWVFHRQEIGRALPEAVDLIERAHREDAAKCPQTVCVSQDLCAAYGHADGPGYAQDRIQVATETLARIDPSWPCFQCISSEKVSALLDAGLPEEAMAEMDSAIVRLRAAGETIETGDFAFDRADALRELGRLDEALAVVLKAEHPLRGETYIREKAVKSALYQALVGQLEAAVSSQLAWERVRDTASLFPDWCEAEYELVRHGARTWGQGMYRQFATASRTLLAQGCPRDALAIASQAAELCVDHGMGAVAEAFLELMGSARGELRADCGAEADIARIRKSWEAMPNDTALPEEFSAFLDGPSKTPERAIAAMKKWPEERGWALQVAEFWRDAGFPERGRQVTSRLRAEHPDDADVFFAMGKMLLDAADLSELETLVTEPVADGCLLHAAWFHSLLLERRGDLQGALDALDGPRRDGNAVVAIPLRYAMLAAKTGQLEEALTSLNTAIDSGLEPGPYDWDRMVVARRLGRWEVVRASSARIGIELDQPTGPIDENWGLVRISDPASRNPVWAIRTGPVSARVVSVTGPHPSKRERYGDIVVFEPVPMDDDEDSQLFEQVEVLKQGEHVSYALDGADPGGAEIEQLRETLQNMGVVTRSTAGPQYTLEDPELGGSRQGCYVRVCMPIGSELEPRVAEVFAQLADDTDAPLVWTELAEALGQNQAVSAMKELSARWGMV